MTILYDASQNVKPTTPRSFGRGILAGAPVHHAPCSDADSLWWAQQTAGPDFDAMFAEAEAAARVESGIPLF